MLQTRDITIYNNCNNVGQGWFNFRNNKKQFLWAACVGRFTVIRTVQTKEGCPLVTGGVSSDAVHLCSCCNL